MRRKGIALAVALTAASFSAAGSAQAFTLYSVHTTGTQHSYGIGAAINDLGQEVGETSSVGPPVPVGYGSPFLWSLGGTASDVDPLSESGSYIGGGTPSINDAGDDVGVSTYGTSPSAATYVGWAVIDGTSHTLGSVIPASISPDGFIVGTVVSAGGADVSGYYSINGAPGVTIGRALGAVNSSDQFTGVDSSGAGALWTRSGSTVTEHLLPVPSGYTSVEPHVINDSGVIVGYAYQGPNTSLFETQFTVPSTFTTPRILPVAETGSDLEQPLGLSNSDVLALTSSQIGNTGTLYNLDSGFLVPVVDLVPSGWAIADIRGFNQSGEAAGGVTTDPAVSYYKPAIFTINNARLPQPAQPIPRLIPLPEDPQPAIPLTLRWTAKAPAADPSTRSEAQVSADGGKTWTTVKTAKPTATSFNFTFTPGATYQVRVAATDSLNNTTGWVTGKAFTPMLTDQADQSVTITGQTTTLPDKKAVDGSVVALNAGAQASFSFTGSQVGVVARLGSKEGTAELFIDGKDDGSLKFTSAKTKERDVLAGLTLSPGAHTLSIVAGSGTIDLDGFTTVG